MTRSEAKARAEALGAKVAGSVSKQDRLRGGRRRCRLEGDEGAELGVTILSEDEWLALIGET